MRVITRYRGYELVHVILQSAIRTVKNTPILGPWIENLLDRVPGVRKRLARMTLTVYWRAKRREGVEYLSPQTKRIYENLTLAFRAEETNANPR